MDARPTALSSAPGMNSSGVYTTPWQCFYAACRERRCAPFFFYGWPGRRGGRQARGKSVMKVVAIQGNIGCGKSSLLSQLRREQYADHPDVRTVPEPVEEWSEWLGVYYRRLQRHRQGSAGEETDIPHLPALQLQLQVLASLHRCYKELPLSTELAIFERSPVSSRQLFVARMVEQGEMNELDTKLYDQIFAQLGWMADIDVYIRCSPETCYKRIQQRGRDGEEPITLAYLRELHQKHEEIYGNARIVLDGELDTATLAATLATRLCEIGVGDGAPPPRPRSK